MDKQYVSTSMSNFEKVNEEFVKCTIAVNSYDQVANGTKFRKEAIMKALPTINYAPVVGYFTDDFNGHGIEYKITDDGFEQIVKTVPFGVVIKDSYRWEQMQKDNGEYEEYVVVDAYLWGRYADAIDVVKQNRCNQSMEVNINSYEYADDYVDIKEFTYSALCILGENVAPAFNLAKIRTSDKFSKDEFKSCYAEMTEALDKFLNFEEGGEEVQEEEKKIEMEEETTEPKVEEPVVEDVKTEEEPSSEEFENKDDEKEPISSNFELSFDEIRDKLDEMIRYQVKNIDVYRHVYTVYNDHFIYEEETYGEEYAQKHYKQGYSKTESEVVLEGERVEVFAQFLTKEEIDKLEADKAEFEKKHADEINELKSNFVDLQGELEVAKDNYSKLEEEVVSLRKFKANIEFEEHKAMVDERLDKYSELETIDGYSELVKDKYTCDIDALEKEIKVFAFDNGVILGKKQKKNFSKEVSGRIPVAQKNVETRKESAWDILDKYVPNK